MSARMKGWAIAVAVAGVLQAGGAVAEPLKCSPTLVRVNKVLQTVPADQDLKYGKCLFGSTIAFKQVNPESLFASCGSCHPSNRSDSSTHAVLITTRQGTVVRTRQTPDLQNVQFNVPLGWDGRFGGVFGDQASIIAAIKAAAVSAINSPLEMGGNVNPNNPADKAKLAALAAFIIDRAPTEPDPEAPPAPPPPRESALTLSRIKAGADVFFGRSASTAGLLAAGKACVSCHAPPFFTDNKVRTNVLHPDAAYDFIQKADGSLVTADPGAGLTLVTDRVTGRSVRVGTFKTPSLHRFYPDGEPALHGGNFGRDAMLFLFYEKSLGFKLGTGESVALHNWLVHCPKGATQDPNTILNECN